MEGLSEVGIVVRCCGERTTPLLLEALKRLLPFSEVHVVKTRPFFNAVLETFSFGRQSSAQFILALDGDVLLDERAPEILHDCIQEYDLESDLRVHFRVRDKFLGIRGNGNHLYNNRYSAKLYEFFVNDANPHISRPESTNVFKFAKAHGLNAGQIVEEIIGLHGYEQYFRHIYQSMLNLGVKYMSDKKSLKGILKALVKDSPKKSWRKRLETLVKDNPDDLDYQIALEGFVAGLSAEDVVRDYERYADITELLKRLGIVEKSPLGAP